MIVMDYMDKNEETKIFLELNKNEYKRKTPLKTFSIKNGIFLSWRAPTKNGPLHGIGGVIDENFNYVIESASVAKGNTRDRFNGSYEFDVNYMEYLNETVVYLGLFHKHWGHFLMDFVPRLWYAVNEKRYRFVYTSDGGDISGNYKEFLCLLGITEEKLICISSPTQFKEIIIPELSYIASAYYTDEFRDTFNAVVENVDVQNDNFEITDKIYLSRSYLKTKEIGENRIERNFKNNGYKVLHPEEMSLREQIVYFNNCKEIVALSGTLCHNILFSKEGVRLIILNKTKRINEHQILINKMMHAFVIYVDVYIEPFRSFPVSYGMGPFWITEKKLSRFFKDEKMKITKEMFHISIMDFFKYVMLCVQVKLKIIYRNAVSKRSIAA